MSVLAQILLRQTLDTNYFTLSRLFTELVELDAATQFEIVQAIAVRDAEHGQKLRQLLNNDRHARTQKPLPLLPTDPFTSSFANVDRDRELSASITLLEPLGEGGMGEVWKAQRTLAGESANRPAVKQMVAVKLLKAFAHDQNARDRFHAEQTHLVKLTHPNIARLLDAGQTASGTPWIALELVSGQIITDWCDTHQLEIAARLTLFTQVCAAVQFAHDHLVIHRDIKPSNVLVDAGGQVKLLDFGIAKSLNGNALTGTQERFFSLYCVSPEQLLNQAISTATDSYGLGALLYQLLCGATLLPDVINSPTALENFVVHTTPIKPSARASDAAAKSRGLKNAAELQRALRGDLDKIVLHALRKQPSERYRSVSAFAQDIQAALTQQPVLAVGQSARYRAAKFFRRHWLITAAASAALVALMTLTAMLYLRGNDLKLARDQALSAQAKAETERQNAQTVNQFLIDLFKRANPLATGDARGNLTQLVERGLNDALTPGSAITNNFDVLLALMNSANSLGETVMTRRIVDHMWRQPLTSEQREKLANEAIRIAINDANPEQIKSWIARLNEASSGAKNDEHIAALNTVLALHEGDFNKAELASRSDERSLVMIPMRILALAGVGRFDDARQYAKNVRNQALTDQACKNAYLSAVTRLEISARNFPSAELAAVDALHNSQALYGMESPQVFLDRNVLAEIYLLRGKLGEAVAQFDLLLDNMKKHHVSGERFNTVLLNRLIALGRMAKLERSDITQLGVFLKSEAPYPKLASYLALVRHEIVHGTPEAARQLLMSALHFASQATDIQKSYLLLWQTLLDKRLTRRERQRQLNEQSAPMIENDPFLRRHLVQYLKATTK
jgi:hypothetical protein